MAANRSVDAQVPDIFRQSDIMSKLAIFCEKYNDDISWKVDAVEIFKLKKEIEEAGIKSDVKLTR